MSAGHDPSTIFTSKIRIGAPASGLTMFGCNAHQKNTDDATIVWRLTTVGAQIARIDMVDWWPTVEWVNGWSGPKGVYDFSKSANLVSILRAHRLKICWTLTYNNQHYATSSMSPIATQANIDAYIAYALATLKQYYQAGDLIELYNEPNLSYAWNPPNATQYAVLMAQASATIRSFYPTATILTGGISNMNGVSQWGPYLQTMVAAGLSNVSGVAFHGYNGADPFGQYPESEAVEYDAVSNMVGGLPLHVTENGYRSAWCGATPGGNLNRQAILTARAYLTAVIMGTASYIHYDLFDDGADQTNPENTYGLFNSALVGKPAGIAKMALFNAISGAITYDFNFDSAQCLCWLTVYKQTSITVIAWTYNQPAMNTTPVAFLAPISGSAVGRCRDLLGGIKPAILAGGLLSMMLTEAEGPVIVDLTV